MQDKEIRDASVALRELWRRLYEGILEDTPGAQAIFLHGLSRGMVASCNLFEAVAAELINNARVGLVYNSSDGRGAGPNDGPGSAWPGANWYVMQLQAHGVHRDQLIPGGAGLHTRDECDKLVALAKERGWNSVMHATLPFHWPRVLSCMVGAMVKFEYRIKVYFLVPPRVDWTMPLEGSQGLPGSFFLGEAMLDTLQWLRYWKNGEADGGRSQWGAPPEKVMEYLDWRDGRA